MFEVNILMELGSKNLPVVSNHEGWNAKDFRKWATNYVREQNERRIPLGLGKRHLAWIRDKRTGRFI